MTLKFYQNKQKNAKNAAIFEKVNKKIKKKLIN